MNPSAASYTPTFSLQSRVQHDLPQGAKTAGPQPARSSTLLVSPMVLPRDAPVGSPAALPVLNPAMTASLSAADRLRLLYHKRPPAGPSSSAPSSSAATATPSRSPAYGVSAPTAQPTPLSGPAQGFPPPPPLPHGAGGDGVVRYTRAELRALREPALEAVRRGPIADAPPFTKLPASFVPLLDLPFALEFVDVDAASQLTEGRRSTHLAPFTVTASDSLPPSLISGSGAGPSSAGGGYTVGAEPDMETLHFYHCAECARGGPQPCAALSTVIANAKRYIMTLPLGRCFLQSPDVVWGQIQLALVFEAKQSSLRLRTLAERFPAIPRKVGEYLYGEGYHLPLPKVTDHEEWRAAMQMLKFDAIRDNRTRVITDVSKHWRKRHTQFEQFVTFFSYRTARPRAQVRNIITSAVKPGMVAMLSGDVVAMVLLHNLGFFIPPDYYWSVFPFLEPALGDSGSLAHDVVRHLGGYYAARQDPGMYNPIVDPFAVVYS